eukprot:gene18803-20697_t
MNNDLQLLSSIKSEIIEQQDSRRSENGDDMMELFDDHDSPRKKQSHIAAEQKRRDAIKKGYDHLQSIVPGCKIGDFGSNTSKISQARVLQKSLEHMKLLLSQKQQQDEELAALEKEVEGLKIMKENYEQLVQSSQLQVQESNEVSEEEKLIVFMKIIESMWQTFKNSISVASFQMLSSSIFGWLEKYCKPHLLKDIVVTSMRSSFTDKK